ncbi:MAG: hypothetical protein SWO11_22590 [Thermodesulfobacteriota bacterium]|nr:hypothetical protein [Thermodesulfobacteriota bacterium]
MGQMGMRRSAGGGLWGRRERNIGGSLHNVCYVKVRARGGERPRLIMTSLSDVLSGASSRNEERPEFPKAGEGGL